MDRKSEYFPNIRSHHDHVCLDERSNTELVQLHVISSFSELLENIDKLDVWHVKYIVNLFLCHVKLLILAFD